MPEKAKYIPNQKIPSAREQELKLVRELWNTRNTDLLLNKIVAYQEAEGFPSPEVRAQYEKEKLLLTALFGGAHSGLKHDLLFHGTGAYKYAGEKYAGKLDPSKQTEVLAQVLHEGLRPQRDVFMPTGDMQSISLAESYFYAKWYADKYLTNPEEVQWQFGNPDDWFIFFMADSALQELEFKYLSKTVINRLTHWEERKKIKAQRKELAPNRVNKLMRWLSSLNSEITPSTLLVDLCTGHSNIPNNYGAVVCFEKTGIATLRPSYGGAHELRTSDTLAPELIKSIGVPLNRLEEARALLGQTKSPATVFSLEGADLHLSQFPLEELAKRIE